MIKRETWAKVVSLSLLPAVWAVVAGLAGVVTAAVGMIAATVCVMGAKGIKDYVTMTVGFLIGLLFAMFTNWLIGAVPINPLVSVPVILIVVVAFIVVIQSFMERIANLFAWLCSFSVGLTVLGLVGSAQYASVSVQLAVSMLVGVWFIAWLGGKVMDAMMRTPAKKEENASADKH